MPFAPRTVLILGISTLLPAAGASAQVELSFTRVADTSTAIPNGVGNFTYFDDDESAIDGSDLVFDGYGSSGQEGLYSNFGGVLTRVVDTTTPTPGGAGTISSVDDPALSGSILTFKAWDSGGLEGFYSFTTAGAVPTVIADTSSAIPGGTGNFTGFSEQSFSNGVVLFGGAGSGGQEGMYTNTGGVLAVVADTTSLVPGGSGDTFADFFEPAIRDGNLSFKGRGSGGLDGLYADFGSGLTVVADTTTAAPGGGGNFTGFDESSIDGPNVAFQGRLPAGIGVYLSQGGMLSLIADTNTAIPDGIGNFTFAGDPAQDGGIVVFEGTGSGGQEGIYLSIGGLLAKIIAVGDPLDGRTVSGAGLNPHEAIRGDSMVFLAEFTDGSAGVYVAEMGFEIFWDGFETGDTLAWSLTVPWPP